MSDIEPNDTRMESTGLGVIGLTKTIAPYETDWYVATHAGWAGAGPFGSVASDDYGGTFVPMGFTSSPDDVDWYSLGVSAGASRVELDFFHFNLSRDDTQPFELKANQSGASLNLNIKIDGALTGPTVTIRKTLGTDSIVDEFAEVARLATSFSESIGGLDPEDSVEPLAAFAAVYQVFANLVNGVYNENGEERTAEFELQSALRAVYPALPGAALIEDLADIIADSIDVFWVEQLWSGDERITFKTDANVELQRLGFGTADIEIRGSYVENYPDGSSFYSGASYSGIDIEVIQIDWSEVEDALDAVGDGQTSATIGGLTAEQLENIPDGESVVQETVGSSADGYPRSEVTLPKPEQQPDLQPVFTEGDDRVTISGIDPVFALGGNDYVTGNFEDNQIYGDRGNDTILGLDGNDRLYGGSGNDRVFDGRGNDTVELGSGDDYVRVGGGQDSFDGGSGRDLISYFDAPGGVTIDLGRDLASRSSANDDTISNFENVSGSRTGNDIIYGTTVADDAGGDNVIRTYGGNDRVFDYTGDDTVELGSGNDYVRVGGGTDSFDGGSGVDYISYIDAIRGVTVNLRTDTVFGSLANHDTVVNFESVSGSSRGDDVIYGTTVADDAGGDNVIRTYGGNDRVFDYSGDDTVELGSGDDYVRVGGGQDSFDGGSGTDFISYFSSSNGVRLDFAADTAALSWADNDTVVNFEGASGSRTGDDDLRGDENENVFRGNGGEDRLLGRDGDDRLYGGDDNDRLFGGDDDDQLYGDDGDDFLHGGRGTDSLTGGSGIDTFHFDRGDGDVTVLDFENNTDVFQFDNFTGAAASSNQAFFDAYVRQQGNDVIFDFGAGGTLTVADTTIGLVRNDFDLV